MYIWNRYQTPESIEVIERVSGKSVQKFIDDNVYCAKVMREEAVQHGVSIIETTNLTPADVAGEIVVLILPTHRRIHSQHKTDRTSSVRVFFVLSFASFRLPFYGKLSQQ